MTEKELVQRVFLDGVSIDKIGDCGNGYYYELTRDCTDWGLWWYVGVRHFGAKKFWNVLYMQVSLISGWKQESVVSDEMLLRLQSKTLLRC